MSSTTTTVAKLSTAASASAGTSMALSEDELSTMSTDKIRLNVGGKHFVTTVDTLCKEESMLSAMFGGKFDTQPDADEEVSYLLHVLL